jgi:hypothetical protein
MAAFIDLTGHTFARLVVLYRAPKRRNTTGARWICHCTCGTITTVDSRKLRRGHTTSCGCWNLERRFTRRMTHGLSSTPEYAVFRAMIERCRNPNNAGYRLYGARGIRVEWSSFPEFLHDMGKRPSPKHSIERVNNDGNYSKENCVWALPDQQHNNKRSNRRVMHNGESYTVAQLARHLGMSDGGLRKRLRKQGLI